VKEEGLAIQEVDKNRSRITIQSIQNLPTLSVIISQMVKMLENENSSPKDLSDLISRDQSTLAAILKLVNSAFYGFPRKITSIHQAIVILGFNTVKSMALGASIFKSKPVKGGKHNFDRNALWIHSVGVGTAAKILARQTGYKDLDEAFVAGLMHDVGKVVFDSHFPEEFKPVVWKVDEEDILILQAEREVMGIDHAEAGQILLSKWQLPLPIVGAVAYHHNLEKAPDDLAVLAAIVHLADIICRKLKIGSGGDTRIPHADRLAMKNLKLTTGKLEDVLKEVEANRATIELFKII
jgi:putative nucleotidyltransferase with HDIG domain